MIRVETLTTKDQSDKARTGIASESGHYYFPDGRPCYTITGKNGKERTPYLKEAMVMHLVPGVTTITGQVRKYGLELYGKKQTAMSALTMPRKQGESDEDFVDRIITESAEHGKLAAERGTDFHASIEAGIQGLTVPVEHRTLVHNVMDALNQYGIDLSQGKAEHSFACKLGFGGKIDWHTDDIVLDFKTKDKVKDVRQLAWPEHCQQLSAYDVGLSYPDWSKNRRLVNVFVGITDEEVRIHEWTQADSQQGWQAFKALLSFWQITKNYTP